MSLRLRKVRIVGDVAHVPLTNGKFAIIDASDADAVGRFNWSAKPDRDSFYAATMVHDGGRRKVLRLHRFLMPGVSEIVDHMDGDKLNCRRSNLRPATIQQNNWNVRRPRHNKSGFKGVSFHRATQKWRATIGVSGIKISLGLHHSKESAHRAYQAAARKYFGEFARFA